MVKTCKICNAPLVDRREVERFLDLGHGLKWIADKTLFSRSSIWRHEQHRHEEILRERTAARSPVAQAAPGKATQQNYEIVYVWDSPESPGGVQRWSRDDAIWHALGTLQPERLLREAICRLPRTEETLGKIYALLLERFGENFNEGETDETIKNVQQADSGSEKLLGDSQAQSEGDRFTSTASTSINKGPTTESGCDGVSSADQPASAEPGSD